MKETLFDSSRVELFSPQPIVRLCIQIGNLSFIFSFDKTFQNNLHPQVNLRREKFVKEVMEDFYTIWSKRRRENEKQTDDRLLKRLRVALLFWLISFVITLIWFTFSP